jgi:hypothetical protein
MTEAMVIQGRELHAEDIGLIRSLLAEHGDWHRTRISEELCRRWDWRNGQGRLKDMAARTLLLKLERAGLIQLPKRRGPSSNGFRNRNPPLVAHATESIRCALRDLRPLAVSVVEPGTEALRLFNCLLHRYHYLGHRNTVGENLRYLVRDVRERNLQRLTNNTRFLVLPWVVVPHLASHVLGLMARRIRADWQAKYGHPVHALETFVDRDRFKGTCYRAANWLRLGATRGRTRNDREHRIRAAVKDVYLYPLVEDFRRELCAPACSRTEGLPALAHEAREQVGRAGR